MAWCDLSSNRFLLAWKLKDGAFAPGGREERCQDGQAPEAAFEWG